MGSIPACAGEPLKPRPRRAWRAVYPRVCGGTGFNDVGEFLARGLSPRVRGNRAATIKTSTDFGSIPACAGEPRRRPSTSLGPSVYPRVCGGTAKPLIAQTMSLGLSPRVRGNHMAFSKHTQVGRSIPACAGEPYSRDDIWREGPVYPRVCGGTPTIAQQPAPDEGLSPRVRGNRGRSSRAARPGGSIPACAGEPSKADAAPRRARVYPRVCGGTSPRSACLQCVMGLSPRVRGNPQPPRSWVVDGGSIPACAGEPCTRQRRPTTTRVYPRVCGGTSYPSPLRASCLGLSPRVRGNRAPSSSPGSPTGSIPACAGEPAPDQARLRRQRVYPRVCGGTYLPASAEMSEAGLSPRVRGNHECGVRDVRCFGSIPACAGEPPSSLRRTPMRRVYPRVCGGTDGVCMAGGRGQGLSPRVRGNLPVSEPRPVELGSIPACAGEPA